MDLSAVIFVVLAIAWAGYLIPKAVKHHDEAAGSRLEDSDNARARVLARRRAAVAAEASVEPPAAAPEHANIARAADVAISEHSSHVRKSVGPAARTAAKRRRRVLYLLLLAAATVAGFAWFAMVPWWSTAIPGALVVLFLLVARHSVRVQQRSRIVRPVPQAADQVEEVPSAHGIEDTADIPLQEVQAALADDGALWDPLPVTLPTYVSKATARRTVRTIELTGISSSGHDAADTALARQAESQHAAEAEEEALAERKVAGA